MSVPEPSPRTKPSRSLSNGRLARLGSSLNDDVTACSTENPDRASGATAASAPPVTIMSTVPSLTHRYDSPMASLADAHADTTV